MTDPTEPEQHTCPRRMGEFGPWPRTEGSDTWEAGHGVIGQDRVGLSCSFCGSLHPDAFMAKVREGWIVEPTDKNYKAYLWKPYTDEEIAARKQQWLATDGIAQALRRVGEQDGKTPEQIDADLEREWADRVAPLTKSSATGGKFYFQHLSSEQRDEFIALYNSHAMRVGYPGYFYRPPFFTRTASEEAATD